MGSRMRRARKALSWGGIASRKAMRGGEVLGPVLVFICRFDRFNGERQCAVARFAVPFCFSFVAVTGSM